MQRACLTRLRLSNIRSFGDLDLSFTDSVGRPRMTNVVIGRNGTGKSTLLRCIVLGLADQAQANALRAEDLARNLVGPRGDSATICVELAGTDGSNPKAYEKKIQRGPSGEAFVTGTETADVFVCGYGAGRSTATAGDTGQSSIIETAFSLFNYEHSLNTVELSLRRLADYLGDDRYGSVIRTVKQTLLLSDEDEIRPERGGGVTVSGPSVGTTIALESWADGYRLGLALILDIYASAMRANSVSEEGAVRGILLIDEVEQHLHPTLQATLVPEISKLFEHMQLIATTHSPLATMGVDRREVVALRRDGGSVDEAEWLPDFTGFSVDEILEHDALFATEPYGPEARRTLARWRELASKEPTNRTQQQVEELRRVAEDFRNARPNDEPSPFAQALEELQRTYDL